MRDRAWYGISSFEKFRSQRFESFERFVAIHDDTNYREGRKYRRENDLHGRSGLFATDYLRLWFIERSHERWRDDARNWNLSMDGPRSNRPFEVFAQCRCVQLRDRFMGNRLRRPRPVPRAHAFTSGGCGGTKRNTANFAIQFSSDNDERNGTMLGI